MQRILRKAGSFIGSLGMAVALLILIAMVLAWGTFYEARFGTESVQRFVYRSWWFQTLLAFLAVNLAMAALERFPWQRKHVPFVLAHIGIILILIGGIVGGLWGIEGQMIIPEGKTEQFLHLHQNVLVVHPLNPGGVFILPTRFETQAWIHRPGTVFEVPFKDRSIQLLVDRYYPNAQVSEGVTGEGSEENPAVHLVMSHQDQQEEVWLFAKDPEKFGVQWEKVHALFLGTRSKQQYAQLLQSPKKGSRPGGILPPNSICLVLKPSEELIWVLTGPKGERKLENFKLGQHLRHPWADLEFRADAFYPKAKVVRNVADEGDEIRQETIHLIGRDGSEASGTWLQKGVPASLVLGKEEILLEYRKAVLKTPMAIKLIDFRKTDYPGTQMAAGFESDVEMTDPERGLVLKRKITMNNPLKYRGFSFFQSGFLEGPVETTVLSVRKDPGTPLVYAGFLIVIAGVVSMFIFRRGTQQT
ncbi:MAG: cytochrome c biogenesis protein ResB [Candidatus Omnitrophica bacterium]|nr:cytochrome c biogenesis protein ResB [Candidatus Omnitrophota bacterium]